MEAKMRNHADQNILMNESIQIPQDEIGIRYIQEEDRKKNYPAGYLKFWGNDYPYLIDNRDCIQGCLPIPENSEAQRLIRSLRGYPLIR